MPGGIHVSPWVWQCIDQNNAVFKASFFFTDSTRALTSLVVFRDPSCLYIKVFIGLGSDGTPDTSPQTFLVPSGTTTITSGQLSANGFNTIDDVLAKQITAGT
jgi:hypothetical protein